MKFSKIIAITFCLVIAAVGLLPYIINSDYVGDAKVELNTAPQEIWAFVNDMHHIPTRWPKFAEVEVLENTARFPQFKIYTQEQEWIMLEANITSDSTKILTIQKSSIGYTGTWTYLLEDLGHESCRLNIKEKSNLYGNYWLKLLLILGGRNMLIKEELRSIQAMAKEGL